MQIEWVFCFNDFEFFKFCFLWLWDCVQIERGFGGDIVLGWYNFRDEFWKFCYFIFKDRWKEGNKFFILLYWSLVEMRKEYFVMC